MIHSINTASVPQTTDSLAEIARSLSDLFAQSSLQERLAIVVATFPDTAVITTNGGNQSRVVPELRRDLLHDSGHTVLAQALEKIPFILIDTGHLFPEVLEYARGTSELYGTNLLRVAHDLTPGEFKLAVAGLTQGGLDYESAFDQVTKVRVLKGLRDHPSVIGLPAIDAVISGNRRDQSKDRASLPFVESKNGLLYFYPLADQTSADVSRFMKERNIEPHPLRARGYVSIGNTFDTRPVNSDDAFEKDSRHGGTKTECGIHLGWLAEDHKGRGVRVVKSWDEPIKSPRTGD